MKFCVWSCEGNVHCNTDTIEHYQNDVTKSYNFNLTMFDNNGNIIMGKTFTNIQPTQYLLFATSPIKYVEIGKPVKLLIEDYTHCIDGAMPPLNLILEDDYSKSSISVIFKCLPLSANSDLKKAEIIIPKYNGIKLYLNRNAEIFYSFK